jgi:hypothetical protein
MLAENSVQKLSNALLSSEMSTSSTLLLGFSKTLALLKAVDIILARMLYP